MENKNLTKVYNKKTHKVGYSYKGIIINFYDEALSPKTLFLNPILFWLDKQSDETLQSIAHVLIDPDEETVSVFFKNDEKPLKGYPQNYLNIEVFENFPYGCDTTSKLWQNYARDSWQNTKPINWGEPKKIWGDLNRKDIWS